MKVAVKHKRAIFTTVFGARFSVNFISGSKLKLLSVISWVCSTFALHSSSSLFYHLTLPEIMMSNGRVFAFLFWVVALATYGGIHVDAQNEAQVVEVFQEADAIPSPEEQETNGRTFGPFRNFDALTYKENLLHNKISFLFSLVPRPNVQQWNRPPYPGGFGPYPFQQGAIPPGYPSQFPPGGGSFQFPPPQFGGGGGMIPGQGFYPGAGLNNPYYPGMLPGAGGGYPGVPGFYPPGILPVVAENNNTYPSGITGGGGNKPPPSASASVAAAAPATSTAAPTTAAAASGGEDSGTEEESKRHNTIKMMPKSFFMN